MKNPIKDNMPKEKLYFSDEDDTFCTSLESRIKYAMLDELDTITLIEAIPDNEGDYIWCNYEGEATEREMCKKAECSFYSSKSGRGICEHRAKLYLHGEKFTFTVPKVYVK